MTSRIINLTLSWYPETNQLIKQCTDNLIRLCRHSWKKFKACETRTNFFTLFFANTFAIVVVRPSLSSIWCGARLIGTFKSYFISRFFVFCSPHKKVQILSFKFGYSRSGILNEFKRVLKKRGFADHTNPLKTVRGARFCRKNMHVILWLSLNFVSHRGPHKSCWRFACGLQNARQRPLFYLIQFSRASLCILNKNIFQKIT